MSEELVELQIVRKTAPHLAVLDAGGMEIYAPSDFNQIEELVQQTGRERQTPMLSVTRNDFTSGNAFWLFLMVDGRCVGGCAAHLIDLREESFEHYLRRVSKAQYSRSDDPIEAVAPPVSREIRGKLIYLGELELHPDFRGRVRALSAFIRMLQAIAVMKWPDFDWMYAFIPFEHVKLTGHYGFTWQMPYAITWKEPPPPGRLSNHWMIALPRAHFHHFWATPA